MNYGTTACTPLSNCCSLQERSTADQESLDDDLQQAIAAWNQAATIGRQSLREVQAALEQAQHSAQTNAAGAAAQLQEMDSKVKALELAKTNAEQGLARSEAARQQAYTATQQVGIRLQTSRGNMGPLQQNQACKCVSRCVHERHEARQLL